MNWISRRLNDAKAAVFGFGKWMETEAKKGKITQIRKRECYYCAILHSLVTKREDAEDSNSGFFIDPILHTQMGLWLIIKITK
ncbi:MAG: hypothetical protein EA409_00310 [Saprospirales bacterium]|nr:MAG: hypothetical protein EA409_00310 [Saprospirales bacterium]